MKKKKEKPQQYQLSKTNVPMLDYKVYVMSKWEKIGYFLFAFCVGAAVGFVFYGNLFEENGVPTNATRISNLIVCGIGGTVAGVLFLPIRRKQLKENRQKALRNQFRDLLSTLSASFTTGKNVSDAFQSARNDLLMQYPQQSYIILEVDEILAGINNNISPDQMLEDLGSRSGNPDILNFANVFRVCYQRGGSLKDVVRRTNEIISEKMACADEIQTKLTSNKTQLNIMCLMPIGILALLRFTNEGFAGNFAKPLGIISISVGIVIFIFSYKLGQKIIAIGE